MKRIRNGWLWFLPAVLAVLLLFLAVTENVDHTSLRAQRSLRQLSYRVEVFQTPESPAGEVWEYRLNLEEAPAQDGCLAFYTVHQYVEVYIGGELVAQWKPTAHAFIQTVGSNWTLVPLSREDWGKEILVRLTPVYESVRGREVTFWEGPAIAVYTQRLRQDFPQLLVSGIAILMGLVFLGISLYPAVKGQGSGELCLLGLFCLIMGLWRINDTRFSPFLMPEKPLLMYYTSLGALMLGCLPLTLIVVDQLSGMMAKLTRVYIYVVSLLGLGEILAQVVLKIDLRQFLPGMQGTLITGAVLVVADLISIRKKQAWGQSTVAMAVLLVVGILADVARYHLAGNSSELLFTLTALLCCVALIGVQLVMRYTRREKELQDSQTKIMLSQIQPHFLYNALCVIQDLCHGAAPEAEKATVEFSEFLRSNLDSLRATAPIPFEAELKHTRNYLSLERRRFGEDLKVVYDIGTVDFRLPALTLEPIAENAVRYGVLQREEGGTVWISTREKADSFVVSVRDDGVGFDVTVPKKDGRSHIGIQNVRDRLERMCGGSLEIVSTPGKGTVATIIVPKERNDL